MLGSFGSLQLVEVGPLLAARGFRVLSLSPPGFGETPALPEPDDYLPSRLARIVLRAADEHGVDRFAFVGSSWGGVVGVHLAARHPERVAALVLLDGGHVDISGDRGRAELERAFEQEHAGYAFDGWDALLDHVRARVRPWRPALEARYRAGMTERDGKVVPLADPRAPAWAFHGAVVEPPSREHERLTVPVLLVLANDGAHPDAVARFRRAVPQAEVVVLDSGHDVAEGAPHELADLVAERLG